jgi:hypothetical protein
MKKSTTDYKDFHDICPAVTTNANFVTQKLCREKEKFGIGWYLDYYHLSGAPVIS